MSLEQNLAGFPVSKKEDCGDVNMHETPSQEDRDAWQTKILEAPYDLSRVLKDLHVTNPWPEYPVLEQAMNTLATELWDRCFSLTEIRSAFEKAVADLPRYAAGQEVRP